MARKSSKPAPTRKRKQSNSKLLPKLTQFFYKRALLSAILWLCLVVFGISSYTTFLKREGFPSVNIPLAVISGTYFVNDPAKVDAEIAKPLIEAALSHDSVKAVDSQSSANFFVVTLQYEEGVDAKSTTAILEADIANSKKLPKDASTNYGVPYFGATGGDSEQIDAAISFYSEKADTASLSAKAAAAVEFLSSKKLEQVKSISVKEPFEQIVDPGTGREVTVQRSFDRYSIRENGEAKFYNSVIIGVARTDGGDVIELDKELNKALDELESDPAFSGFHADISASFAPSIQENLDELQRVLLEGLLAVLIVGSLVIAIRASIITVISMITVLAISLGFLYLFGYTLNVITLFALILSLALIVDDTIIMVEAIDAARRKSKRPELIVKEATSKVSRAMLAATLTACLSFAPLLFVGGILGDFIAAIPVTIIVSLSISLLVALVFIPFFARFILLGRKQVGEKGVKEVAAGFEKWLASTIARPMVWARGSTRRLYTVGVTAVLIGLSFIVGGVLIARDVVFNIFPPTKDTNAISVNLQFKPGTTINAAEAIAARADSLTAETLGENFEHGSYFASGGAESANLQVELLSYTEREVKSPQLVEQLQQRFDEEFSEAKASVGQVDIGPPAAAFTVQLAAENRAAAFRAANDLSSFLETAELTRINGSKAKFLNPSVSNPSQFIRSDGQAVVLITANFDADDTTTLVTLAQDIIEKEFSGDKLESYGLQADALQFDLGQEEENQESFNTLVFAFPALLLVMYVLLTVQFKSFLQPLLIFMAIPFSLFGIMLGLKLTDNAISFFAMLGFFALVGLSIKNTILLTDFANQARHAGNGVIDSAVQALEARFRPLFATSMTAVVSLIPLALSSPFWEGLAVVLICGLLSSTFLVITVFPYYYLAGEWLRIRFTVGKALFWLVVLAIVPVVLVITGQAQYITLWFMIIVLYRPVESFMLRQILR